MYTATYKQSVPNKLPKFYFGSPNPIQKNQILMNLVTFFLFAQYLLNYLEQLHNGDDDQPQKSQNWELKI